MPTFTLTRIIQLLDYPSLRSLHQRLNALTGKPRQPEVVKSIKRKASWECSYLFMNFRNRYFRFYSLVTQ